MLLLQIKHLGPNTWLRSKPLFLYPDPEAALSYTGSKHPVLPIRDCQSYADFMPPGKSPVAKDPKTGRGESVRLTVLKTEGLCLSTEIVHHRQW